MPAAIWARAESFRAARASYTWPDPTSGQDLEVVVIVGIGIAVGVVLLCACVFVMRRRRGERG
ncbi:hypothetical protein [Streptomyces sp. 6N223]|uniref:hypothetical protein n=1 Tax=Streptomyces sp. 6N223 TaxID=3457412 RepID=UPI003FD58CBD